MHETRGIIIVTAAAYLAALIACLAAAWIIEPPLLLFGAAGWLGLFGWTLVRARRRSLLLLGTLPVAAASAVVIKMLIRASYGLPPVG